MAQVNPLWHQIAVGIVLTEADDPQKLASSLLDWWQLAGVEWDYSETPNDWLAADQPAAVRAAPERQTATAPVQRAAPAPAPVPKPAPAQPDQPLPDTLTAFQQAWRDGTLGADGGDGPHLGPSGEVRPRIMVITGAPERDDRDTVLSGMTGTLLDNIARASGIDGASLYRASLFPRVVLDGRAAGEHVAAWHRIALHHIALVQPEMLVVAGGDTARTLLGHDPSQKPPALHFLNHGGRTIKTVVMRKLSLMLHRVAQEKSMAWQNWQLLLVE